MSNEIKAVTIDKLEFNKKAGEAVANGMNRMDRCIRDGKVAEKGDFMGVLAISVFHMKETAEAMGALSEKIFRDTDRATITEPEFDDMTMGLLEEAAKKSIQVQKDGQFKPVTIAIAESMAWSLAFKEMRKILFEKKENKEDEIFQSARESIRRETEKPAEDLEQALLKFKVAGPVGQTVWANTEANQKSAESAPVPEQGGLENAAPAEPDAEKPVKDQTEKQAAGQFFAHIRRRFGF